mmetsp:Transcript_30303/g.77009  ORF Transcript_30303/g.77009 Transcript_30303/m.77009 type:complete len:220 (+) Transcript_30303:1034-1693(+)
MSRSVRPSQCLSAALRKSSCADWAAAIASISFFFSRWAETATKLQPPSPSRSSSFLNSAAASRTVDSAWATSLRCSCTRLRVYRMAASRLRSPSSRTMASASSARSCAPSSSLFSSSTCDSTCRASATPFESLASRKSASTFFATFSAASAFFCERCPLASAHSAETTQTRLPRSSDCRIASDSCAALMPACTPSSMSRLHHAMAYCSKASCFFRPSCL